MRNMLSRRQVARDRFVSKQSALSKSSTTVEGSLQRTEASSLDLADARQLHHLVNTCDSDDISMVAEFDEKIRDSAYLSHSFRVNT